MNRSEYVERLMKIGMLKYCAERTVDAFLERDEYAALRNGGGFLFYPLFLKSEIFFQNLLTFLQVCDII